MPGEFSCAKLSGAASTRKPRITASELGSLLPLKLSKVTKGTLPREVRRVLFAEGKTKWTLSPANG